MENLQQTVTAGYIGRRVENQRKKGVLGNDRELASVVKYNGEIKCDPLSCLVKHNKQVRAPLTAKYESGN